LLTEIITYRNKEVLVVDYQLRSPKDMSDLLLDSIEHVEKMESQNKEFLILIDLTDVPVTKTFGEEMITGGKPHTKNAKKSAIVGVTGIKRLFFETYLLLSNSKMKSFKTKQEALEYLVSN